MKGLGRLIVIANPNTGDAVVTGNVINEGAGCIVIATRGGFTASIGGNVESKGDGGGVVSPFRIPWSGSSGCPALPNPTAIDGGPITINGNKKSNPPIAVVLRKPICFFIMAEQ